MIVNGLATLPAAPDPFGRQYIAAGAAQRLCIDLIAAEQARLLREKRMSPRQRIETVLADCAPGNEGDVEIGEHTLGFDSLMLLDLVGVVTRYFCLDDTGAEDLLLVHRRLREWADVVVTHVRRLGGVTRISFETSGSTGTPKRIVHRLDRLAEEADEELGILHQALPTPARILSAVPPRHIYGFIWSVLLPEAAGAAVVELHRSPDGALFRHCQTGDVVLGTPFTWERAALVGKRLPPGVTGVTSAGPSSEPTWQAAEKLGLERLVEIYGSTETGGVGWRDSGRDPFRLLARVARSGDALKLDRGGEPLAIQDRIAWRDERTFLLAGRRDAIVQVAGTNVSCDAVSAVLARVNGVAEAAVRLDGSRLVALVVPEEPDADLEKLEDAIRMRLVPELTPSARPDRYLFVSELPRNEIGKLAPWPVSGAG